MRLKNVLLLFFIALFCFFLLSAIQPSSKAYAQTGKERWAVIVGVSDYLYADDFWYAADDAQDLYNKLKPIWGADHIKLLTNSQATKGNIRDAIYNWLDPREDRDDTVLFFFSGGGRKGYIGAADTLPTSYTNDVSPTELDMWLDALESQAVVTILDSCFSGAFINALSQSGRVVLTSSAAYEESYEFRSLTNGVFSYYVLEGFERLDDVDVNRDNEISAEELFRYAAPKATQYVYVQTGGKSQHPQIYDGYAGELVVFTTARVTFNISPSEGAPLVIFVDDVFVGPGLPGPLPISFTWIAGSVHTLRAEPSMESPRGDQRWYFASWSDGNTSPSRQITASTSASYTAIYKTQYFLRVASALPISPDTIRGAGWYDANSEAKLSISPTMIDHGDGTAHVFTGWSPGGTIKMDSPKTVTANWKLQYALTVKSEYGDPKIAKWYNPGETITLPDFPNVVDHGDGTGHQFTGWSPGGTIKMDSPKTVTANWQLQYKLTVKSEYGEPKVAEWYNPGETITLPDFPDIVDHGDGTGHKFTGWSPGKTIKMDSPKTVTANWKLQYALTVKSPYGEPKWERWHDVNAKASFSVPATVDNKPGSRYKFVGWSGDSTATTPEASLEMNLPKTIIAKWRLQYLLTLKVTPLGITSIGGEGWYDAGIPASTGVAPQVVKMETGTRYVFLTWKVDNTEKGGNPISITMDSSHVAAASYETQHYLTLQSEYGNPQGAGWHVSGSEAIISVTSPVGIIVRHVFVRWSEGTAIKEASTRIFVDKPKTITADWRTDYLQLYAVIAGMLVIVVAILGLVIMVRRRRIRVENAPRVSVEVAAAKAEKMVADIKAKAAGTQVFTGEIESKQTICPQCGKPAGEGKYCNNCGAPLALKKCPKCGAQSPAGTRFCGECGTKLV